MIVFFLDKIRFLMKVIMGIAIQINLSWSAEEDSNTKHDILPQDYQLLETYINDYKRISEVHRGAMDVHQFNREMNWKEKLPKLISFDEQYIKSDPQLPFETVAEGIRHSFSYQVMLESEKVIVQAALLQLKNYFQTVSVEAGETGADMPQLISRCWSLVNFEGDRDCQDLFSNRESTIEFMMDVLSENLKTFGGCYPGYAGRFCQFYLLLINSVTLNQQ